MKAMSAEQERSFRDASVFSQLSKLVFYSRSIRWPFVVPPSVVQYAPYFERTVLEHISLVSAEELQRLPSHLTLLVVSSFPLENPSLLQYLPKQLLQFHTSNELPKTTPHCRDLAIFAEFDYKPESTLLPIPS